jgi:hypothetical protein
MPSTETSHAFGRFISAVSRWPGEAAPGRSWVAVAEHFVVHRDTALAEFQALLGAPAKTPAGATATCGFCFRDDITARGTVARHGYRQAGRGTGYAPIVGGCRGDGYPPLEVSRAGTDTLLQFLDAEEPKLQATSQALLDGTAQSCRVEVYLSAWESPLRRSGYVLQVFTQESWATYQGKNRSMAGPGWTWADMLARDRRRYEEARQGMAELRSAAQQQLVEHGYALPAQLEVTAGAGTP